jgi:hypothetical protein
MKIRIVNPIKNVALAVAVIALGAPMAHSQTRQYNALTGKYTTTINRHIYRNFNPYANSGYSGNSYMAYLNDYSPSVVGSTPSYFNNAAAVYPQGGALVLGSDGRIYDPYANNGAGAVDPSYSRNGVTFLVPMKLSDQIETIKLSDNRIRIVWSGDPRPVAKMRFSLLDSKRVVLRNTIVTDIPADAVFTRPSNAVYYRVMITYGDGAMRSIVAPL